MHDAYTPFKDLLKKRQQSFVLEIETRRTISEHDGGGGIFALKPLDLGFEVLVLLPRRHPGVDGFKALVFIFGGFNVVVTFSAPTVAFSNKD